MTRRRSDVAALDGVSERLGYRFTDVGLLREALTHPSAHSGRARKSNYQRLEFLGDRVLALAIADALTEMYPDEPEGTLSRRLTQLVRAETCADVARRLGLGNDIVMGIGEAQSGGRDKTAILSDVAEAVIGAVYRDGGYNAARDVVRNAWSAHLDMPAHAELRDPKTALQEWAQARGMAPPVYTVVERRGPEHAPEFVVRVEVPGHVGAEGSGPSKRLAEQVAARAMLAMQMPRSHA